MKAVIINRDRISYARICLAALLDSDGIDEIYIVDHGSTYPPMLDWLSSVVGNYGNRRVHAYWRSNAHPRDLWTNGTLTSIVQPGERFIVTDHDVVAPIDAPWVAHLGQLLDENPHVIKAGLQLRTIDLDPAVHHNAQRVIEWESQYRPPRALWGLPKDDRAGWVSASVDTTLAMYRDVLTPFALDPALRTVQHEFEAIHMPWYEAADDSMKAPEAKAEQDWYRQHAAYGHWRDDHDFVDVHGL